GARADARRQRAVGGEVRLGHYGERDQVGRRARVDHHRVRDPEVVGERALERLAAIAHGEAIGVEHGLDRVLLLLADGALVQGNAHVWVAGVSQAGRPGQASPAPPGERRAGTQYSRDCRFEDEGLSAPVVPPITRGVYWI